MATFPLLLALFVCSSTARHTAAFCQSSGVGGGSATTAPLLRVSSAARRAAAAVSSPLVLHMSSSTATTSADAKGVVPTWTELQSLSSKTLVGAALTAEADLRTTGRGSSHVESTLRLFDSPDGAPLPKITLYRDHAGWCPYCQKTMLLVEEKRVPIKIELVPMRSYGDKPASFTRMVPGGLLPAIKVELDDGRDQVITESQVIMELLDKWHPPERGYRPMLPPEGDTEGWQRYDALANLERDLFGRWCNLIFRPERGGGGGGGLMGMLTGGGGGGATGDENMSASVRSFLDGLDRVDAALTSTPGPWFFSSDEYDHPTMIDCIYVSHLERMLASCAYWKGLDLRSATYRERYPGINAWFDAFEKRECYLAFKSDYYTHVMDIPPQYGPGFDGGFGKERAEYQAMIRGKDGTSWNLPLPFDDKIQPLYRGPPLPLCALEAAGIEPNSDGTYENADHGKMAIACCHMAGWKLSGNGDKVSSFAARGGPGGASNPRKTFGAELADPYAAPDKSILPSVDAALRIVCKVLLENSKSSGWPEAQLRNAVPVGMRGDVSNSLAYLRDRIGVPRDLPLASARHLRAHLNQAIDVLEKR